MIRGVYRFDDNFCDVEDEKGFQLFVAGKLKFLPSNVVADVCKTANLSEDFRTAQQQRTLPAELLESAQVVAQRTKSFFRLHRYFDNALVGDRFATDAELKDAQNFLRKFSSVKKILAPLLNEEGLRAICPQRGRREVSSSILLSKEPRSSRLKRTALVSSNGPNDLDDFTKRQNYIMAHGYQSDSVSTYRMLAGDANDPGNKDSNGNTQLTEGRHTVVPAFPHSSVAHRIPP